jgi:hypothetical protein
MNDDFKLSRSFAIWTMIAFVAVAAMIWGLEHEGIEAGIGINVGWFGLFISAVGLFRKAPWPARLWPIATAFGVTNLWVIWRWFAQRDEDAFALVLFTFGVFGFFAALMGLFRFLTRRGWVHDSPLRRKLELTLVFGLTMTSVMGLPTGVWRARLSLATLIAFVAIACWPPSNRAVVDDAPSEPASSTL